MLAVKLDDLSLIPGSLIGKGENNSIKLFCDLHVPHTEVK